LTWKRVKNSVAEPHNFFADPASDKNFDAAPALTLLYSQAKFLKQNKVKTQVETTLFI
jgi:hypothetical protein